MTKQTKTYLYGAREVATGKLVSNITNPRRKYWDKKGNAVNAIEYHNHRSPSWRKPNMPGEVELVTFELVEVKEDDT
jgi:hypothetical protein